MFDKNIDQVEAFLIQTIGSRRHVLLAFHAMVSFLKTTRQKWKWIWEVGTPANYCKSTRISKEGLWLSVSKQFTCHAVHWQDTSIIKQKRAYFRDIADISTRFIFQISGIHIMELGSYSNLIFMAKTKGGLIHI
jgi:hypothetical protein